MIIHICDRCKKELEEIEKYIIPDFNNCNGIMSNSYYIYDGRPVRVIELCPQCKKRLGFLLSDFLEGSCNA